MDTKPDISVRVIIMGYQKSFLLNMEMKLSKRMMAAHIITCKDCPFTAINNKCPIKMG
jgi:hypothetical protein